jgi:hypothetical protein
MKLPRANKMPKPTESMKLVNYSLDEIIRVDKYRLLILKHLGKMVLEEYDLKNYQICVRYAFLYLKLYRRVVREYSNTTYVDTREKDDIQGHNMKEVKYVSPKYLDRVISAYMECRKFLVGPNVHKLIQEKINPFLPRHEKWATFTTFHDMMLVDGVNESEYQTKLKHRYNKCVNKLLDQLEYLEQFQKRRQYWDLLQLE